MSDLAPFVAAAIRDQVVSDLQNENKELKLVNEERKRGLRLSVTGPHGTPVYAMGSITDAEVIWADPREGGTKCRSIRLENFENVPRPSSVVDIMNAELWIGEHFRGTIRSADDHAPIETVARVERDDGASYLQFIVRWNKDEFSWIDEAFHVGPFIRQEAERLERLCQSSNPPMSGLTTIPNAIFCEVELVEPNFVEAEPPL